MPETKRHLLLVDDEDALRDVVSERLSDEGFEVTQATNGEEALKALGTFAFDVIVSDLRLPGVDGREVIKAALDRYPSIVAIVVTGYGTVRDAVEMIKVGAADFIAKPFQFDELMHVLNKALEQRRLTSENAYLHQQLDERFGLGSMVGKSAPMRALFQLIESVAPTAATILITGETGTGKEMVARAIHQTSPRHRGRFVAINVSAIPETLLDAELFGHARGAFTGANTQRHGRFEQADGGTLFLDEIGDMSMPLQTRLLRVLAEGEFYRVGGQTPIRVDVRVIAATHQTLEDRVASGLFREDLYHRLNVIRIELPPLRARAEDIPDLLRHYMHIAAAELGVEPKALAPEAFARLTAHDWPGNVRELVNLCRRLTVLAPGSEVHLADLPPELANAGGLAMHADWATALAGWAERHAHAGEAPLLDTAQPQFERVLIQVALKRTQGHRQDAARLLGWGRNTLTRKLKELGMNGAEDGGHA
jgi:two-component system, NtrC family, nitrogen regulation response regulator GlnG